MTRRALTALLCVALGACASAPTSPSRGAALGEAFDLRVGESALIRNELLELRFEGVASDSRCPIDVVCIQAGDAELRLAARRLPESAAALALHTQPAHASASFQGFAIVLLELGPPRKAGQDIAPGEYVANLKVTRP